MSLKLVTFVFDTGASSPRHKKLCHCHSHKVSNGPSAIIFLTNYPANETLGLSTSMIVSFSEPQIRFENSLFSAGVPESFAAAPRWRLTEPGAFSSAMPSEIGSTTTRNQIGHIVTSLCQVRRDSQLIECHLSSLQLKDSLMR